MGLEQNNEQHYRAVVDKFNNPNADYRMTTRDYVLRVSATPASGDIVITLPSVSEAKGRFYSIVARLADVVNDITITDREDSECWLGDITLDGKCDHQLLYSDGLCWIPIGSGGPGRWPGFETTAPPGTTQPSPTQPGPTAPPPTQ